MSTFIAQLLIVGVVFPWWSPAVWVLLDHKDHRAVKVLKARKVFRVLPDQLVRVLQAQLVQLGHRDHREILVHRAFKDQLGPQKKALQEQLVQLGHKDHRV